MKSPNGQIPRWIALLLVLTSFGSGLWSQGGSGAITGVITDQTGAAIPGLDVVITGPDFLHKTVTSDQQGEFKFDGLTPGEYHLQVSAEGFAPYAAPGISLAGSETLVHRIELAIAATAHAVTVTATTQLDVEPSSNASALVVNGADLNALADDPDDLAEDLQALAGPAGGPNGGEIFVDGFSDGRLPPKSAIREIRINQNPFSAEYDRLGFGRIEILTKPGADRFRGEAMFNFGDSALNSRNPFVPAKPDYQRRMIGGSVGGPISSRSSFLIEAERRDVGETSAINALVLSPVSNVIPYRNAVLSPTMNTELSLRLDHQLNATNTLVGRYEWEDTAQNNAGLDTFSLPSRSVNTDYRDQALQITETAVLNANAIHDLRFQFRRSASHTVPASFDPAIQVSDAFNAGGADAGLSSFKQNRAELSDVLSLSRKEHMIKLGGRVRGVTQWDWSKRNYNGLFTFTSLDAYRITLIGIQQGLTPQQIRAAGGGASQFAVTAGNPLADVGQVDAGLFLQDDWRILPQMTLTAGLRYEVQNNIADRRSFAPRIGLAWAPGRQNRQSRTVIRAGFGMFYDRVGANLTLQANRLDGLHQQQYLVPNPDFYPGIPLPSLLSENLRQQAIRELDNQVRAPYTVQSAVTVEQQLPKNTTVSLIYTNLRGVHLLRSRDINAPLPGTYDLLVPDTAVRPFPGGDILLYESSGTFRQNQFIVNANARVTPKLSLFGYYVWNKADSDSDGTGSFPASQYDLRQEYGRAGFDVRHRAFLGGSITAPYGFILNPFVVAASGGPFNITTGDDLNGDSLFNDRPAWATDFSRPSVRYTSYGIFDTSPLPGQTIIPRNHGGGPARFLVNLRLAKSFGFSERSSSSNQAPPSSFSAPPIAGMHGHGGHGGSLGSSNGSRYSLTFSVAVRNLLNWVNLAPPVGNLSSPSFGTSVALAGYGHHGAASANRTVELQVRFSF